MNPAPLWVGWVLWGIAVVLCTAAVVPAPRGGGAPLLAPVARSTSMRAGLSAFAALAALRVAGVWGLVAAVVVLPAVWRMTKGNGLSAALPLGMGGTCFGHGRAVSPDRVCPAASGFAVHAPEKDRAPVNPGELAACSAVAPLLAAAGVPDPDRQAPEVLEYLRRFGFAVAFRGDPVDAATTDRYLTMALDMTIVEAHGGPRTCGEGTRDAVALRRRLEGAGMHLARTGMSLVTPCPTPVITAPVARSLKVTTEGAHHD